MSSAPILAIEQSQEARRLDPVLGERLRGEHQQRLAAIHQFFAGERDECTDRLAENLRLWSFTHTRQDDLQRVLEVANTVREKAKAVVVIGIGGSDLAPRVIHQVLDASYHNLLSEEARRGAPELYFTGNTFDPKRLRDLLDMLAQRSLLEHTVCIIVSKSGTTGETISSALVIAEHMKHQGITEWQQQCVAITGMNEKSVLYSMHQKTPFLDILPIHDGVGGRFSGHTEVGLLPALVTAAQETPVERLAGVQAGLKEADRRFFLLLDDPENVAFHLASWIYQAEVWGQRNILMFYNYADDDALGDWMVQLVSESIQERGRGLNLLATTGPTGNHSILNGVVRGPRDKCLLLLQWEDLGEDLEIPTGTGIGGDLQSFEGLKLSQVQMASYLGTAGDLAENGVPHLTLKLGCRDTAHLFALFRVLMDTVAVLGKLHELDRAEDGSIQPTNELTYLQHGVEGYKNRTREQAKQMQEQLKK